MTKTKELAGKFGKQLLAYSATAGVVLMASPKADAAVVYVGPLNAPIDGGYKAFDLNGDTVNDILFLGSSVGGYVASNNVIATGTVLPLPLNYSITAGNPNWKINGVNFIGQIAYFGVKFKISGNTHYGWIRYAGKGAPNDGVFVDFAYESVADTPILAGAGATVVELVSFKVQYENKTVDNIVLEWETATEKDNAGFHLWRSEKKDGKYEKITGFIIPAKGSATSGSKYSHRDFKIDPDKTYFYKLEDVDENAKSTMHGPVKVGNAKENEQKARNEEKKRRKRKKTVK